MVRKIFFIFLLFSYSVVCKAQDNSIDTYQQRLQECCSYFEQLGCRVDADTLLHLFQTIFDWIGTPYHYSGETKDGIDCSGFVGVLFKKAFDAELAASSADIYKQVQTIKKKSIQAGDLVFFKIRKKRVSHVGVYIGNNKFAHASVQQGVIVSDLSEPYYKKYFYKAGRLKEEGTQFEN